MKSTNSGKKIASKKGGRKPTQLSFFKEKKIPRIFGGSLLKGNPKTERPLSEKEPIHLVMKSIEAFGLRSMLQQYNVKKIDYIIRFHASECKIKIYRLVNVGNHLHVVLQLKDKKKFAKFIRTVSGLIARHVLKKERGPSVIAAKCESNNSKNNSNNRIKKVQFWIARPFTRLIAWGKDFERVSKYMYKNNGQARVSFEVWGFDRFDFAENSS